MKTNFKRLFALVLTLCMLASLMVPVVFAEDEAVEAPAASASVAETYPIRLVDMSNPDYTTATAPSSWFKGSSGWKNIAMSSTSVSGNLDTWYAAGDLNWRYIGTSDSKYYYYPNVMMQPRLSDKDTWAALQIRVSEDGRYALNLHTDKTADDETEVSAWTNTVTQWKGDVTAYIFSLADYNAAIAAGAEVNAAVESLMTEENCVGTQSLAADETDVTFNKVTMEAGEYVVVYSASAQIYCISEMTLLEDAADAAMYEYEQVVTYPIQFADPTVAAADWASGSLEAQLRNNDGYTNKKISAISTYISNAYDAGELNWKYLAEDATAAATYRANTALQLRSAKNGLVALQIDVPAAGNYALTVGVDRNTDYTYVTQTYAATAINISAYLLKASADVTVSADTIASLAVEENSVGAVSLAADVSSAQFEKTYLEAGSYVLIYAITNTQANVAEFGLAQRKIDMPLTAEGATVTQHIEVNALEIDDPNLPAGNYAAMSDYVASAYAAGKMDWKVENYADQFTDANFSFVNGKGLKAATPADSTGDWFALRIRVAQSGNYSMNLKTAGDSAQFALYMFPAAAETMSAEAIAAQMTDANGIYFQDYKAASTDAKISCGYLEGEYVLVFQSVHASKSRTVYIDDIILETEKLTAEDVQFYNFNLYDETNAGYYEMINSRYEAVEADGVTTYTKLDPIANGSFNTDGYVLEKDADGNPTALGTLFAVVYDGYLGYPNTINWRPDAAHGGNADTLTADMKLYGYTQKADPTAGVVFKVQLSDKVSVGATQYASFMLHVDKAGTYELVVNGGYQAHSSKVYFVDAFTQNVANGGYMSRTSDATIQDIFANGTGLVNENFVSFKRNTDVTVGQVTVDTAGDYLIIFETNDTPINQDDETAEDKTAVDDVCLNSISLVPVIEDVAAIVGGVNYASFEDALAAAEADTTITLMDNVVTSEVSLGENVTLNLNGYALTADSVDAIAPGAQIIDGGDGIGMLRTDALELSEDNAQLPLYNATKDYYCFYNAEVDAIATTGTSNATKYWFKVNFSNADALALFEAGDEMNIQVSMTGVYKAGHELEGQEVDVTAVAQAEFVLDWANNSTAYIVVSTVGSNGLNDFVLNPEIAANGVVIAGDDMVRGV